jgi:hypothetical protein
VFNHDCDSCEIECLDIELCLLNMERWKYENGWNCINVGVLMMWLCLEIDWDFVINGNVYWVLIGILEKIGKIRKKICSM